MKINTPAHPQAFTHEGTRAFAHLTPLQALRRSVLSTLLWEDQFYEDGQEISARILDLCAKVPPSALALLAIEARTKHNLRHVPLLLLSALAKHGAGTQLVSDAIAVTIQRADELTEFLAIYAKANGVGPDKLKSKLSAQVKKGLAKAFTKFSAYNLAKYNRDGAIKLRDALFLCHAKPLNETQAQTWAQLVAGTLPSPDTWEVALSTGADKKATFERLLVEGKLGYLALLRNLRNMVAAQVSLELVKEALLARKGAERILPFRYVAAARACLQLEPTLDMALCAAIAELPTLSGQTVILVDVSGSMDNKLSAKSDLTRMDAAATLASLCNGDLRIFSFSENIVEVPPRRGMAGVDAIIQSQHHEGTRLFDAVTTINRNIPYTRLIVITDEQATTPGIWGRRIQGIIRTMPDPNANSLGYLINVGSNKNGVGYGKWTHIDGFSEHTLRFILESEAQAKE